MNDSFSEPAERNKRSYLPTKKEILAALSSLSKPVRFLVLAIIALGTIALVSAVWQINKDSMVQVPSQGGVLTEGIIGSPRFINPLLAVSDADRDLTSLIYSGLTRRLPSGELVPDLASQYEISEDGLTYTFHLKEGLTWHDGEPLTTKDIAFTITKAVDPSIKSIKRTSWEGVGIEIIDDLTIKFNLSEIYAGFLSNTTLGILPAHLWSDLSVEDFSFSELNTKPVGSGPYKINKLKKSSSGIPQYYLLKPFENFALGKPNLSIRLNLYPNESERIEAYKEGAIEAVSAVDPSLMEDLDSQQNMIITALMPRVFGVFFNQNQSPVLGNESVRQALDKSIDKQALIDKILFGFGRPLSGPLPINTWKKTAEQKDLLIEASQILEDAGWEKGSDGVYERTVKKETQRLAFTLSTLDTPDLKRSAEEVVAIWRQLGAEVELKVFEAGTLQQTIIRPRKYDALLFGQIIGGESDLFPFWHSSQRLDPGTNVALYTNLKTDKILEEARKIISRTERNDKYLEASAMITEDLPAVFLYSPYFIYIVPSNIKEINLGYIGHTGERFNTIYKSYLKTERVWKLFADSNNIIK